MGPDVDTDDPPEPQTALANVAALLSRQAAERPDAYAIVDHTDGSSGPRRLTWAELDRRVEELARGLAGLGLVAGQRLGLVGGNRTEYVVGYLAALRGGLVAVPVDPHDPDEEIAELLAAVGAHHVLAEATDRAYGAVTVHPLTEDSLAALSAQGHSPVVTPLDPEALAVLLRTAGTSGPPKTVMLSHRALLGHLAALTASGLDDPETVVLAAVPFSHVLGLNTVLGGWLVTGARLVIGAGEVPALVDLVATERVTTLPVTPRLLYEIVSTPELGARLAGVRTVLAAAAPLPWQLAQDFTAATGLRVERGYGLTEAAAGVSSTLGHEILGPAHVGRPLAGVEVGIGGEPGEPGPVLIRGDNLFSGYWPDGLGAPEGGGWFDTGDIGYLTGADLFLVDRARELVVVNGFTVYPSELEQAVRELPGVTTVAAVGVGGEIGGEIGIVLFVAGAVTVAEVLDFCRSRLAPYKRPTEVRLVDDLPRGVTGKVRRSELRRWAARPAEADGNHG